MVSQTESVLVLSLKIHLCEIKILRSTNLSIFV